MAVTKVSSHIRSIEQNPLWNALARSPVAHLVSEIKLALSGLISAGEFNLDLFKAKVDDLRKNGNVVLNLMRADPTSRIKWSGIMGSLGAIITTLS